MQTPIVSDLTSHGELTYKEFHSDGIWDIFLGLFLSAFWLSMYSERFDMAGLFFGLHSFVAYSILIISLFLIVCSVGPSDWHSFLLPGAMIVFSGFTMLIRFRRCYPVNSDRKQGHKTSD